MEDQRAGVCWAQCSEGLGAEPAEKESQRSTLWLETLTTVFTRAEERLRGQQRKERDAAFDEVNAGVVCS